MNGRWHRKPPTKPGWYNASQYKNSFIYRWWNGEHWSLCAIPEDDKEEAARCAAMPYPLAKGDIIYWREIKL